MALLPPSTALSYPQIVMSYLNNFWITGVLTLSLFYFMFDIIGNMDNGQ